MSNQPQPRLHVAATPAPHAPDRSVAGWYSSPRQSPPAGVDSSTAARAATAAVSRSVDGDTYEGLSRDAHGNLRFVDPDGQATLVIRGQGTSQTEVTEPVAADTVDAVAGWGEVVYALFWMAIGVLFCLALT